MFGNGQVSCPEITIHKTHVYGRRNSKPIYIELNIKELIWGQLK